MCGRYTLTQTGELADFCEISETQIPARFNIAPTQQAPVVRLDRDGSRVLTTLRWGLIPSGVYPADPGTGHINARSETVHSKPSFRRAFRRRRCLVPADGFYEWEKNTRLKQPYYIRLNGHELFTFAGIWEKAEVNQTKLLTFSILTCDANSRLRALHPRMPVIIPAEARNLYLDPEGEPADLLALLKPFASDRMTHYPVSKLVNRPVNDDRRCIEPQRLEEEQGSLFRS